MKDDLNVIAEIELYRYDPLPGGTCYYCSAAVAPTRDWVILHNGSHASPDEAPNTYVCDDCAEVKAPGLAQIRRGLDALRVERFDVSEDGDAWMKQNAAGGEILRGVNALLATLAARAR